MSRWDKIEQSKLVRVLKSAHELIIIGVFYVAFFGIQVSKPNLEIIYSLEKLDPPIKLASLMVQESKARASQGGDPLLRHIGSVAESKNLLLIELKNNSPTKIEEFELKVVAVAHVADLALTSTSDRLYTERERLALFKLDPQGVLTLPNLNELPPNSATRILVWGHFLPMSFVGDSVEAAAAVDKIVIKQRQEASGLGLFVANNISSLAILLVMYLVTMASLRYRRRRDAVANS